MQELGPLIKAAILGIVEGLTEFLPISSTGHLILAGELLAFNDEKGKAFLIMIQTGAMLAVMWQYRVKFWGLTVGLFTQRDAQIFVGKLFVAFLPAAIIGLLFGSLIKAHLFGSIPVAIALIAGAFVILAVERFYKSWRVESIDAMTWRDAFLIGIAQCFSLVPGVSRAGATIIGGMLCGLSRKAATEFSFFLAVPTLIAAGGYDLMQHRSEFSADDVEILSVGLIVSFISALVCIRWLLRYVASHTFNIFAWYRIALGAIILIVLW
ncbi:undecaprenyl-diphosphate phosphatase [Dongia deserti]|uniref:undecaprenyl-diphosphate phosphatase n=1 Tax=Dongia deserti TaxID=2268030 RepID=UPI000E64D4F3|nr:undecaprenyl-diphosphate phosphatase [Dongia deserti]